MSLRGNEVAEAISCAGAEQPIPEMASLAIAGNDLVYRGLTVLRNSSARSLWRDLLLADVKRYCSQHEHTVVNVYQPCGAHYLR